MLQAWWCYLIFLSACRSWNMEGALGWLCLLILLLISLLPLIVGYLGVCLSGPWFCFGLCWAPLSQLFQQLPTLSYTNMFFNLYIQSYNEGRKGWMNWLTRRVSTTVKGYGKDLKKQFFTFNCVWRSLYEWTACITGLLECLRSSLSIVWAAFPGSVLILEISSRSSSHSFSPVKEPGTCLNENGTLKIWQSLSRTARIIKVLRSLTQCDVASCNRPKSVDFSKTLYGLFSSSFLNL